MAEFECKVYKLTIEEHPNADALELAIVGDYRSIVRKGQFETGDLGVYIPEASVCPDWLIESMGLTGRLAGKAKNRVKAVKLRGILSQGLVYPVTSICENGDMKYAVAGESGVDQNSPSMNDWMDVSEGDDVTDFLGITKWEPPIPVHMAGEVFNAFGRTPKYDIENYKKYPDVLQDGEDVVITEKIHGTWCCFGYHPEVDTVIVTSKGLSSQGLAFKINEANVNNLYIRALNATALGEADVLDRALELFGRDRPMYILGEVYGQGVQDLHYGATSPKFRVFDIYNGEPGQGSYVPARALLDVCVTMEIEMVPELYRGPFSKAKMLELTDGKESVSGEESNIREGVVIKPFDERRDLELGRVALKSVSEKYLLRKGGTEFN